MTMKEHELAFKAVMVGTFFVLFFMLLGKRKGDEKVTVVRDTVRVVKTDTVAKVLPVHDTSYVVRHVKVKVESGQSNLSGLSNLSGQSGLRDSEKDSVTLAVEQKVYRDSDYVAWVSGVMPSLDSLNIFRRTETVTITETITKREKASRWSVGLQGGYGYGIKSKQFEPFVGVGVSYRILP